MDLKNTIDKTDTIKNDLKLARNKINDKIISGGGTIANTISNVPEAIDEMLRNYKKIADIDVNVGIKIVDKPTYIRFEVPNFFLDFTPSRYVFSFTHYDNKQNDIHWDTKNEHFIINPSNWTFEAYWSDIEYKKSEGKLIIKFRQGRANSNLNHILAIE